MDDDIILLAMGAPALRTIFLLLLLCATSFFRIDKARAMALRKKRAKSDLRSERAYHASRSGELKKPRDSVSLDHIAQRGKRIY